MRLASKLARTVVRKKLIRCDICKIKPNCCIHAEPIKSLFLPYGFFNAHLSCIRLIIDITKEHLEPRTQNQRKMSDEI